MMFDVFSYARDNDVSVEVIPLSPAVGMTIRIRDLHSAAQESTRILFEDLAKATRKDVYIEKRCDQLLECIGKRKKQHGRWEKESEARRRREAFFRDK